MDREGYFIIEHNQGRAALSLVFSLGVSFSLGVTEL